MRLFLLTLLLAFPVISQALEITAKRFEGFGTAAIQDTTKGGTLYTGGLRYTPVFSLTDVFALKTFAGGQYFKDTAKVKYFVLDYGLLTQFEYFRVAINLGGGATTSFRKDAKGTNPMGVVGAEYKLPHALAGVFDRLVLNGHYVFNSSDLYIITYGLSAVF